MNQVGGGAEIGGEVGILRDCIERGGRAEVSVLADQRVDGAVFAEFLHGGREDDQLGSIGQRHARAVDSFVAEPGAVKLVRVEIDDGFAQRLVEHFEIDFEAEFRSSTEALDIVADEEAPRG